MSTKPEVAGGSVRSSNGGQADDKRLKLGQEFDPRNNALNAFRLVGHDVGDAGVSRDVWWLACGGRMMLHCYTSHLSASVNSPKQGK